MYGKYVKRIIDVILSFFGLVILSPIFLVIIIAIKCDDSGSAVLKQLRMGRNKKPFKMYKFRTMKVDTPDIPTYLLENPEKYITKTGRFLRRTSLDELPQLINILKGDMSIIGPRPVILCEDELNSERDKYGIYNIKPGLTGWAQINGRDEVDCVSKAKLDAEYMENMSFGFDVKCFFGTVLSVLRSEGVVEGGTSALEKEQEKEMAKE